MSDVEATIYGLLVCPHIESVGHIVYQYNELLITDGSIIIRSAEGTGRLWNTSSLDACFYSCSTFSTGPFY